MSQIIQTQDNPFAVRPDLYSNSAIKTIANTVAETSIFTTGINNLSLPASYFTAGKRIVLFANGIYSAAVVPGTLTVKCKLGSTIIASIAINTLVSTAVNLGWDGSIILSCFSTGSTGTVQVSGALYFASNSTGTARATSDINNGGATSIIDTTIAQAMDFTVTWSMASASNSVSILNCFVKDGN